MTTNSEASEGESAPVTVVLQKRRSRCTTPVMRNSKTDRAVSGNGV